MQKLLRQKNYEKEQFKDDNCNFHEKERTTKEKLILVTIKMEKFPKHNEMTQYIKEVINRLS